MPKLTVWHSGAWRTGARWAQRTDGTYATHGTYGIVLRTHKSLWLGAPQQETVADYLQLRPFGSFPFLTRDFFAAPKPSINAERKWGQLNSC